jgi:hypothetical protein
MAEPTDMTGHAIVSRHHSVGASTGYMSELRDDWDAQVAAARAISPSVVELSALSEKQLAGLRRFLGARPRLPFRYLSVHGPAKDRQLAEDDLVSLLSEMSRRVDAIVMHPDTLDRPDRYRKLRAKLAIENVDVRKRTGRTVGELVSIFDELPEAGFCFDVAHAWSIDPDMSVANELVENLGDRLRHVHLSSLSPELHHVPLTGTDEELFGPVLERCVGVPWILEAPLRRG